MEVSKINNCIYVNGVKAREFKTEAMTRMLAFSLDVFKQNYENIKAHYWGSKIEKLTPRYYVYELSNGNYYYLIYNYEVHLTDDAGFNFSYRLDSILNEVVFDNDYLSFTLFSNDIEDVLCYQTGANITGISFLG